MSVQTRCLALCAGLLAALAGRSLAADPAALDERDPPRYATGQVYEALAARPSPLPSAGPPDALVTADLFVPLDPTTTSTVALLLRLIDEVPELRLVYHPMLQPGPVSARAAEILWEARAQRRFFTLCARLTQVPALLTPEREADLLAEAGRLGLDPQRLAASLQTHRHRPALEELAQKGRLFGADALEVWVNGQRLRGVPREYDLLAEIDRQAERARGLLRRGVPRDQLYQQAVIGTFTDREQRPPPQLLQLLAGQRPSETPLRQRLRVDVHGAPSRGPAVAPVQMVLFWAVGRYPGRGAALLAQQLQAQYKDRVRLSIKFFGDSSAFSDQHSTWYLAQLFLLDPARFWQAFDALAQEGTRPYYANRGVLGVLRDLKVEVLAPGARPTSPQVRALAPEPSAGPAQALIQRDRDEARRLQIDTPVLVINGQPFRGSLSLDQVDGFVRRELERGLIDRLIRR